MDGNVSPTNKQALEAAVSLITDPMVTRFLILTVLGIVVGVTGYVMNRNAGSAVS